MKDEIKEILDYFRTYATIKEVNMIKKVYDYITNLQEENEMYKKELEKADSITQSCIFEGSRSDGKSYRQCLNWLEDYKSRNEKAIEYILKLDKDYDINVYQEDKHWAMVLYILQGSDKDE